MQIFMDFYKQIAIAHLKKLDYLKIVTPQEVYWFYFSNF